jgi:hypothetical protein
MKKYDIISTIFWFGLSIFVMAVSYKYGLGSFRTPGPGLMPFFVSLLLFIICCYLLLSLLLEKHRENEIVKEDHSQTHFWRIGVVLVALYTYALLLETIGYLVATFVLLIILFRMAGYKRWSGLLVSSTVIILITFFVFTYLGLRFPMGILKWR